MVCALTLLFVGGIALGYGPPWQRVPGRYLVEADQRSVDGAALAAARWANANLPEDSRIAADRVSGALMSAIGHLTPVTSVVGGLNVTPLYTDPSFNPFDEALIRRAGIRYIVVDVRLAQALPRFGTYFEPTGTAPDRLTLQQLTKFEDVPEIDRVYDNGALRIYDVVRFLPQPLRGEVATASDQTATRSNPIFIGFWCLLALAVLAFGRLVRLRAETVVHNVACTAVATIFGTLAIVRLDLPGEILAPGLALALVLFFRSRSSAGEREGPRTGSLRSRRLTFTAVVVTTLAIAGAVVSAHAAQQGPSPLAAHGGKVGRR